MQHEILTHGVRDDGSSRLNANLPDRPPIGDHDESRAKKNESNNGTTFPGVKKEDGGDGQREATKAERQIKVENGSATPADSTAASAPSISPGVKSENTSSGQITPISTYLALICIFLSSIHFV
jgi:hypothetical protein